MAARLQTGLSAQSAGRRFGFTVGGAFLAVGGVLAWREVPTGAAVATTLGTLLIVAALLIPAQLRPVEATWMAGARAISKVTTPVVLAVMYFVVIAPAGILRRTFGANPLQHRADNDSYWKRRPAPRRSDLRRQF